MSGSDDFSFDESSGWELDERFADWVDGRLSPEAREQLEAELAADPELRAAAESYRDTVSILQQELPSDVDLEPPLDLSSDVMDRIAGDRPRNWWMPLLGSAAAAAAMIAIFVFLTDVTSGPGFTRDSGVAQGESRDILPTEDGVPLDRIQEMQAGKSGAANDPSRDAAVAKIRPSPVKSERAKSAIVPVEEDREVQENLKDLAGKNAAGRGQVDGSVKHNKFKNDGATLKKVATNAQPSPEMKPRADARDE